MCEVADCVAPTIAKGLCWKHYCRKRRHGDVNKGASTQEQRFWERVNKRSDDGCWVWTGIIRRNGYGYLAGMRAHRLSYEIHHGPIPDGFYVLHHCDNRPCVNPDHLYVGTALDNSRDMDRRSRRAVGSRNGYSKLTEWDVRDIREMWANDTCTLTMTEIARGYKVHQSTIGCVLNGTTWAHVDDLVHT